ncbi:hypothetical protein lbkm_0373 [Lachnospiraceae bacterium KM106-2]|nr:hypothetical protein lbkm_0373 [Lachnospiraceae bacterium KM106-2]
MVSNTYFLYEFHGLWYKTIGLTVFAYFLALILSRLMGRKAISQMTFFDFVVGITLGSITSNLLSDKNHPVVSSTTGLIIISLLVIILDYIHLKSYKTAKIIDSEPVVLVENGNMVNKNFLKTRITILEFMQLLREKNCFNIADIEYAILETNGKLSVLFKSQKQALTPSDMKIPTEYKGLTKDIILDGNIMFENLKEVKQTKDWLLNELKHFNVSNVNNVFYAGLDTSGKLYVSIKNNSSEKEGKYGIE